MKLIDIINNIDKSDRNASYVSGDDMLELFCINSHFSSIEIPRITAYFYCKWVCTDTLVGGRAYFLDNILVATSWQPYRKYEENFKWVSQESYTKVKNYLLSICAYQPDVFDMADLDEEMNEGYHIEYGDQLLTKEVIYNGKLVNVIQTHNVNNSVISWKLIDIDDDGELKTIHVDDFLVPYSMKK